MIKKITAVLVFGILLSFIPSPQKENVYTLTEGQMIMQYNANLMVRNILPTSQAPAITVVELTKQIDSINKILAIQYQNFHPDSSKNKK